jgi:nitrate/nitrite transporter NarK
MGKVRLSDRLGPVRVVVIVVLMGMVWTLDSFKRTISYDLREKRNYVLVLSAILTASVAIAAGHY